MVINPVLERKLVSSHEALESSLMALTDEALETDTDTEKAKQMLYLLSALVKSSEAFESNLAKIADDVLAKVEQLGLTDAKTEDDQNVEVEEDLFCIEEFLRKLSL